MSTNQINLQNLPKFKFGNTSSISTTPIVNGTIYIDNSRDEISVDLNGSRINLGSIIHVSDYETLSAIEHPKEKIYMLNSTGDLYVSKVTGNNVRVWVNLTSTDGTVTPAQLQEGLAGKAAASHTHTKSDITDLGTVGDMLKSTYDTDNDGVVEHADLADVASSVDWSNVSNKPNIPAAVTVDTTLATNSSNAISNAAVATALNNKSDSNHTHSGVYSETGHSHAITDVTNLESTLNGKITNPSSGSTGDVLKKTANGVEWSTPAAAVTVDSALSSTSENPVQNKVVTTKLNNHDNRIEILEHPPILIEVQQLSTFNGTYSWSIANSRYEYNNSGTIHMLSCSSGGTWYLERADIEGNEIEYASGSTDVSTVFGTKTWNSQGAFYYGDYTITISKAGESSGSGTTTKPKLMLTVPISANSADLYLIIQKASTPSGTYAQILNTRSTQNDAQKMRIFDNTDSNNTAAFKEVAIAANETYVDGELRYGVKSTYANKVCVVDVDSLMDIGDYYKYQWVTASGSISNTNWFGGCYPSANEQMGNIASRVKSAEDRVTALENRIQVVNSLPANPVAGILYLIPESE